MKNKHVVELGLSLAVFTFRWSSCRQFAKFVACATCTNNFKFKTYDYILHVISSLLYIVWIIIIIIMASYVNIDWLKILNFSIIYLIGYNFLDVLRQGGQVFEGYVFP